MQVQKRLLQQHDPAPGLPLSLRLIQILGFARVTLLLEELAKES